MMVHDVIMHEDQVRTFEQRLAQTWRTYEHDQYIWEHMSMSNSHTALRWMKRALQNGRNH